MLSERVSRVCIVVLEEVEEDEPSPSPPPPQTKSSPERRSHPVCRKAATHQDKVSSAPSVSLTTEVMLAESESRVGFSSLGGLYHGTDPPFFGVFLHFHTG